MAKFCTATILLLTLLQAVPAGAAREIIIDFDTGEKEERVDAAPPDAARVPEPVDRASEAARLKSIIQRQQQVLLRQQAIIKELREEVRRQQDINRGLELLCRACR